MSVPSVTSDARVADSTLEILTSLLIQSATVALGEIPADSARTLGELHRGDELFAIWLTALVGDLSDSPESYHGLLACLPEQMLVALDDFPCSNQSRENLRALCHLAIRNRSMDARLMAELDRQKTKALYNFAYGLSHELNNPLANISTRAGVLLQSCSDSKEAVLLQSIVDAAMRGGEMLGDLMLIARPPKLQMAETCLHEFLQQLVHDAQPLAERFQLDLQLESKPARKAKIDEKALREALWALVRNSIEASAPEQCIRICYECSTKGHELTIIDTGPGIAANILSQCCDPYFSGREAGRGLGMGLAKVRTIIKLHDGIFELGNKPGGGCQAQVLLPSMNHCKKTTRA
ncbi:MAG: HAMP domain-containing sensor histidine kinase [Planctomycetota bacterium]